MRISNIQKEVILYVMVFFTLALIAPPCNYFGSDMDCWRNWIDVIGREGIAHGYDNGANYMPLFMYFLWFVNFLMGGVERFYQEIYFFKGLILLFDFGAVLFFIFTLFKARNRQSYFLAMFLNIALLFNTLLWGQVDAVYTFFAIVSLYTAAKFRIAISLIFLVLCVNSKLQGIVFVPLVILILLQFYHEKRFIYELLSGIIAAIIAQGIIVMPFIFNGTIDKVWHTITHSVGYYPAISMNAFNIWMFFFPKIHHYQLMKVSNLGTFLGITYKLWGLILFCSTSALVLLPYFLQLLYRNKFKNLLQWDTVLLTGTLIGILFFYCNTEMHERYIHPAVIMGMAVSLFGRNYLLYLLLTLAYFANLEKNLRYLGLHNYDTVFFDHRFVAALWTLILVYFGLLYYKRISAPSV
jgi:Gpi18-like mannosyltransferase